MSQEKFSESTKNHQVDHLILSPHLDDGVFSCGGLISRATSDGKRVHVVSFYTKNPDLSTVPKRLHKFAIYELRKKEDKTALASLGATFEWLDFTERAFRSPILKNPLRVFRTPPTLEGFLTLNSLKEVISDFLERFPKAKVYAPLGIGNHFDHVELFLASMLGMLDGQAFDRFVFYEDLYGIGMRMRKAHFISKQAVWNRKDAPQRARFMFAIIASVMAFSRKGPSVEEYLGERIKDLVWKPEPISIEGHELAKLKAIYMYESQAKAFGSMKHFSKILGRYHKFWGKAEPYWCVEK